jgi:hypothetical protein
MIKEKERELHRKERCKFPEIEKEKLNENEMEEKLNSYMFTNQLLIQQLAEEKKNQRILQLGDLNKVLIII